jgi:hypothetical protein
MTTTAITIRTLLAMGFSAAVVLAGGPAPENRADDFARVCKAGPNGGNACADDLGCPSSTCQVVLARGTLNAVVTIIVDDDVSRWDSSHAYGQISAATVLIEVRKNGTQLVAQTYQNLLGSDLDELLVNLRGGTFLADTFDPVTEAQLNAVAVLPDLLGRFLFQSGDPAIADRLRAIAGVTGTPLVIGVPRKLEQATYADHGLDQTASIVQLKTKIAFTP